MRINRYGMIHTNKTLHKIAKKTIEKIVLIDGISVDYFIRTGKFVYNFVGITFVLSEDGVKFSHCSAKILSRYMKRK